MLRKRRNNRARRVLWLSDYRIMAGAALLNRAGIEARNWRDRG